MPSSLIFLGSSQRRLLRTGVPVLMYHYFGKAPAGSHDPYLYVTANQMDAEFAALRHRGYTTATLSELAAASGAGKTLKNRVVITIDDGAKNFFEGGMKVLAHHGFKAIQFLVAGQIGGINEWDAKHGHPVVPLMDAGQIREWLAMGHEIGSHSMTHRNLSKLSETEARNQIIDSKKQLEDQFEVAIRHFSYPHGKFNAMTTALVEEAGYETACATRFGVNPVQQNLLELQRITPLSAGQLLGKSLHRLRRVVTNRI